MVEHTLTMANPTAVEDLMMGRRVDELANATDILTILPANPRVSCAKDQRGQSKYRNCAVGALRDVGASEVGGGKCVHGHSRPAQGLGKVRFIAVGIFLAAAVTVGMKRTAYCVWTKYLTTTRCIKLRVVREREMKIENREMYRYSGMQNSRPSRRCG